MSENIFEWTDELVREFACHFGTIAMSEFKKSKEKDIPKDWKIISFASKEYNWSPLVINSDGTYGHYEAQEKQLLTSSIHRIESVQRICDGELFTVGDKCSYGKEGIITKFHISGVREMLCDIEFNKISSYSNAPLRAIEKVKPKVPLFTTEDGVEVFVNDTVYSVRKIDWFNDPVPFKAHYGSSSLGRDKQTNSWWYFSTKDAANNFITLNKPVEVSYKEIDVFLKKQFGSTYYESLIIKDFFKSKQK